MDAITPIPVVDEGLGNSSYLLDLGDGTALALDPERDLRTLRAEAAARGLRIAYAVETHLHADFISGVAELAAVEGAEVVAPQVGERAFRYTALEDGGRLDLGRLSLRALHTPGHSPEHLSYLVYAGEDLAGIFTGGSLMVGTAGRTDLVAPEQTIPLARDQYHSLQRLMELPDETPVWPTHGAGSFCSSGGGAERTTTIGRERRGNPLLQLDGEEAFVEALLAQMGTFPDYFRRLPEVNRRGPAVLAEPPALAPLTAEQVRALVADGAQVVDARPVAEFAAGHVPGAISIPFRKVFAVWLGWLADPDVPLVIVRGGDQDPEAIAAAAALVGVDRPAGELSGGMDAWTAAGGEAAHAGLADTAGLADASAEGVQEARIVDVRQASEYADGHVPGALNLELGALAGMDAGQLPGGPVVVMCAHGERAAGGASLLQRAGLADVTVFKGAPEDWAAATGQPLVTGPAR
ncbi:MBL fold metallo-hydrolase [Sinomonas halotolerans]|uniref:Rhodanese-like domain-containing protein n=1 Tax=Sinomonas halotolerans TaxID=1644133 RepID=A0ABU9X2H2_9MICC